MSGTGTVNTASFVVADRADVVLNKNIAVDQSITVNGKLNFNTYQFTGNASFKAEGIITPVAGTGNTTTGAYLVKGNAGINNTAIGQSISGAGIAANTVIVSFSSTNDTIYLSQPLTATASGVALSVTTGVPL